MIIYMTQTVKHIFVIIAFTFLSTFAIWLPHYLALPNFLGLNFSQGFSTIYKNFDGFEYIIIAKTFYNLDAIAKIPQSMTGTYYASHFPGFSLLIAVFAPVLGFLKSMLFASVLSTIAAAIAFYFLVKDFKLTNHPLFLTLIFLILPARWLIVRSVGSAEPLFIFFTILTFYFFLKFEEVQKFKFILLSSLMGIGAQLTRPPGILIFISLVFYIFWKKFSEKNSKISSYFLLILIPVGLLGMFFYFSISFNDFFAYFHSGNNIHLTFPPFQSLNKNEFWVGQIWLEDIIYIFILGFLAGLLLLKQKLYPLAFFVLTYLSAAIFVAHRDISRYTLPIIPFAIIAFEKILVSKEFKIVLIIMALAIYLYSENFILFNTSPIPNLSVYN